jgi:hypothetical protein
MTTYTTWVLANPLFSAAIQFAILGTIGELIPAFINKKRLHLPFTLTQILGKMLAWALLGLVIKYGFAMMKGGAHALVEYALVPSFFAEGIAFAFLVSVITNVFFGPQMMAFHRLEDNVILREWNWQGLDRAFKTLVWFWIPAHTLTFSLPTAYQIGLAALWSVVLGVILGLSKKS